MLVSIWSVSACTGQYLPVLVSLYLYWSVSTYICQSLSVLDSLYLYWSVSTRTGQSLPVLDSLFLYWSVSICAVQSLPVHPGVECPTRLTSLTCLPLHTPTDHSLLSGLSTDHSPPHLSLLTSLSPPHQDHSPSPHHTTQNTSHPLQTPLQTMLSQH